MSEISKIPVVAALAAFDLLIAPVLALGDDVPDALSVEWQGKKPCEKLFEDAQVRVARCTFPPGTVHVCHSHPSYIAYFLHGGQVQLKDEKGKTLLSTLPRSRGMNFPMLATQWCKLW
jgi:hypothetical protein